VDCRIPFYYEIKILFMLWLLSPTTKGSSIIYRKVVHPQLNRRESVRYTLSSTDTVIIFQGCERGQLGMRPRPRLRPERVRPRTTPKPKNFFEAEAEARHVREQLSVYEHED